MSAIDRLLWRTTVASPPAPIVTDLIARYAMKPGTERGPLLELALAQLAEGRPQNFLT
jgi:hypothetical protein